MHSKGRLFNSPTQVVLWVLPGAIYHLKKSSRVWNYPETIVQLYILKRKEQTIIAEAGFQKKKINETLKETRKRLTKGLGTRFTETKVALHTDTMVLYSRYESIIPVQNIEFIDGLNLTEEGTRSDLLSFCDDTFVISRANVCQRTLEMTLGTLEIRVRVIFAGLQIGVDKLDETIEILRGDVLILLIEVVDVAVENLDEKLDGDSVVHAGIGDTESSLETLQNTLSVAVELW